MSDDATLWEKKILDSVWYTIEEIYYNQITHLIAVTDFIHVKGSSLTSTALISMTSIPAVTEAVSNTS